MLRSTHFCESVAAEVRAAEDVDRLAIDAAREQAHVPAGLLGQELLHRLQAREPLLRHVPEEEADGRGVLHAEAVHRLARDVGRDLQRAASALLDAQARRDATELALVGDAVVGVAASGDLAEEQGRLASVVGVRRRAHGRHAREVARDDGVGGRAAHAAARPLAARALVRFLEWNFLGPVGQLGNSDAKVANLGSLLDPAAVGVHVPEN